MRCDQFRGLMDSAKKYTEHFITVMDEIRRTYPDGHVEVYNEKKLINIVKVSVHETFTGAYDTEYGLHKYEYDGDTYYEYVQAEPWSCGPVYFLALRDDNGRILEDTLWPQSEIDNA